MRSFVRKVKYDPNKGGRTTMHCVVLKETIMVGGNSPPILGGSVPPKTFKP